MNARLSGLAIALCLGVSGLGVSVTASTAWAQPKNKKPAAAEAGTETSFEKQSAWEQKVMGEDGAKQADKKKIAAAQKLAEEARKNPPLPEPVKKYKDPNKEGARAKSEASIGLPIESEQAQKTTPKKATVAKKSEPNGSANDELGALVASSLASDRKAEAPSSATADSSSGHGRKGRAGKGKAAAQTESPSSLDRMFSAGK